jgi:putative ABC transport system permease protein
MFWRIWWRLLRGSRARLAVAFLAVASGATVCAALLNLQFDADRKLTREFRTLGANVVVSPAAPPGANPGEPSLISEPVLDHIAAISAPPGTVAAPYLFIAGRAAASRNSEPKTVIIAGTRLGEMSSLAPFWKIDTMELPEPDPNKGCLVGKSVAQQLGLSLGGALELSYGNNHEQLRVRGIVTAGGPDDNQIFVDLPVTQRLAGLEGRVSLVQLSVPGTPAAIEQFTSRVAAQLPGVTVRPIRQIAEGEGRLFSRIKGLLLATVILILVLTALCVLATMAALAMDRRLDVGLMKALGGSMRQVLRLFLLEAGSLGLAGGLVGCGAGLLLSEWVGRRVFGAGVTPRLEVLPITLALMVGVSLAGAFPLRLLARVKPAVIFRGEA